MIRHANMQDLGAMMTLGMRAHINSPAYRDIPVDESKSRLMILNLIAQKNGVALVAEHYGKITGMLLGIADEYFFSRKKYATDLLLYAEHPGDGFRLLREFHRWAFDQRGCLEVTHAVSYGGETVERTEELYQTLGLSRTGGLYLKRAEHERSCQRRQESLQVDR